MILIPAQPWRTAVARASRRDVKLPQRIAAVDEHPPTRRQRGSDARHRCPARRGIATVERPHPDGGHNVERLVTGVQDSRLRCERQSVHDDCESGDRLATTT